MSDVMAASYTSDTDQSIWLLTESLISFCSHYSDKVRLDSDHLAQRIIESLASRPLSVNSTSLDAILTSISTEVSTLYQTVTSSLNATSTLNQSLDACQTALALSRTERDRLSHELESVKAASTLQVAEIEFLKEERLQNLRWKSELDAKDDALRSLEHQVLTSTSERDTALGREVLYKEELMNVTSSLTDMVSKVRALHRSESGFQTHVDRVFGFGIRTGQ